MSEAFKRAGVLYGKLGLTTPPEVISGRYPGIEAAAEALTIELLPELVLVLFGRASAEKADFLGHFANDPRFDVRSSDPEAALLATAICDYAMTEELELAGELALTIIAASVGGMRSPAVASDIFSIADQVLTAAQEKRQEPVEPYDEIKVPEAIAQAIATIRSQPAVHTSMPTIIPAVTTALEQFSLFASSVSEQMAVINNSLLPQIARLEEETRTHWWVVGGWSAETDSFFRDLDGTAAAIQAGWELASKASSPWGLHAAPALLDLVLERGRGCLSDIALAVASKGPKLAWRKENFQKIANGPWAALFPISTMFGLSADSGDEDDWKAAFARKTGLDPARTISHLNLALQIYRERLVRDLFEV